MKSSYEIFYNPPKLCNYFYNLVPEFNFKEIKDMELLVSNPLFRIYSALLVDEENKRNVILLEFLIYSFDRKNHANFIASLSRAQHIVQENPDFHYFYLRRLGYCLNKQNNTIMAIYLNNGNKLIDLGKIYTENENPKLVILMYFNLLLDFYIKHYEKGSNFMLLHPEMIFQSQICGFQFIDFYFSELFKSFEFNIDNLMIGSYFGLFDLEVIELLKTENKKLVRNSADIFLLSIFLAYLFSVDTNLIKKNPEKYKNNYSNLLFKIRGDFSCKNTKLKNFMDCINDKEVRFFLSEVLNLNYKDVASIYKYKELFNSILIESNLSKVRCFVKTCKSKAQRLNFVCKHFLCTECYSTHIDCSNYDPKKLKHDKDIYGFACDNLRNMMIRKELEFNLQYHSFVDYFNKNVKINFQKIEIEQEKLGRYTMMIDEKLNNMIYYIEKLIKIVNKSKNDTMKNLIKEVESEVYSVKVKFEKKLRSIKDANQLGNTAKSTSPSPFNKKVSSKDNQFKLIDNIATIKIIEKEEKAKNFNSKNKDGKAKYGNFNAKYEEFKEYLREFSDFIEKVKNHKNKLNFSIKLDSAFNELCKQESEYFNNITTVFNKDFALLCKLYEEDLFSFHTRAELYESRENNILELYRTRENKMLACLDWVKDILYVYNMKDNADAKFKLNFKEDWGPEPKKIQKNSKWINLGGRLLVTGGLYKKENREVGTKKAFYISLYDSISDLQDVRDVVQVADMLYEREQHCLIHINSFYIAAIGGSKNVECEWFNVLKNEWSQLPSLPSIITNASAVLYNKTNIFIFFGNKGVNLKNKDPDFSTEVYRLRLFSGDDKWDHISYYSTNSMTISYFSILNYNDLIYILGGKVSYELEGNKNNTRNIYEFDAELLRFDLSKYYLPKPVTFFESNFINIGNNEYGLYSTDFHVVRLKL